MSSPAAVPLPNCHPLACAIQACLTRNSADSDKCQREIFQLYDCCARVYRGLERDGRPPEDKNDVSGGEACPNLTVLKRNLKSHGKEYGQYA